jgi:hypothetical protein
VLLVEFAINFRRNDNPLLLLQLGRLPIELAAINDCREEVEMLFPLTLPIPNVPN